MANKSHWQPKMERWALIADINEIIQKRLKDVTEGIPDNTRMTARELDTVLRALSDTSQLRQQGE